MCQTCDEHHTWVSYKKIEEKGHVFEFFDCTDQGCRITKMTIDGEDV